MAGTVDRDAKWSKEGEFIDEVKELIAGWPDLRLWRMNTGGAKFGKSFVLFGMKGQSDMSGIARPFGVRVEVELKTKHEKPKKHQIAYGRMIVAMGGVHGFAWTINDVLRILEQAGISEDEQVQKRVAKPDIFLE